MSRANLFLYNPVANPDRVRARIAYPSLGKVRGRKVSGGGIVIISKYNENR